MLQPAKGSWNFSRTTHWWHFPCDLQLYLLCITDHFQVRTRKTQKEPTVVGRAFGVRSSSHIFSGHKISPSYSCTELNNLCFTQAFLSSLDLMTSRDEKPTTSLGSLFQWLIILTVNNLSLIFNLNPSGSMSQLLDALVPFSSKDPFSSQGWAHNSSTELCPRQSQRC